MGEPHRQHARLSRPDRERDVVQRLQVAEELADIGDRDDRAIGLGLGLDRAHAASS